MFVSKNLIKKFQILVLIKLDEKTTNTREHLSKRFHFISYHMNYLNKFMD